MLQMTLAGLSVSSLLNADAVVYSQAIRNVNDGVSALSITEGALDELSAITQRQIELAEQAANGVLGISQRKSLNAEANALVKEYNRIVESVSFNGRNLLHGEDLVMHVQAGYGTSGGVAFEPGRELDRAVGSGTFSSAVSYLGGDAAYSSLLVDVNNDGKLDAVVAGYDGNGYLSVAAGHGDGTFGAAVSYGLGGNGAVALSAADFNGDGFVDLVAGGWPGTDQPLHVLRSSGSGTFSVSQIDTDLWVPESIATGDFNGDGNADIVA